MGWPLRAIWRQNTVNPLDELLSLLQYLKGNNSYVVVINFVAC